jgi:soluble lytic murein transglycosylase-like protein
MYVDILKHADPKVLAAVARCAHDQGIDVEVAQAICLVESGARLVNQIGAAGEIGVMQVTPVAAKQIGMKLTTACPLNNQVIAGIKYLHWLAEQHSQADNLPWIIRAYNVGPTGANEGRGSSYLVHVIQAWGALRNA